MTKHIKNNDSTNKIDDNLTSVQDLLDFADKNKINVDPLDVAHLTQMLGIVLRLEPMAGEESGSLSKDKKGNWIMTVNSLHHPHRQRFTIAHEIGHYIRHAVQRDLFTDTVFFRNEESNRMEVEANRFAAELLMPENRFSDFITKNSNKVSDIANHFQVSSMAVRIRAQQLGFNGHNL